MSLALFTLIFDVLSSNILTKAENVALDQVQA